MPIKPQKIKMIQILVIVAVCMALSMSAEASEDAERSLRAAVIIDQPVFNSQGEELGELEDLVIKRNGSVKKALISVGGVLDMGDKLVSARYRSLTFTDKKIILGATKKQLDDQAEFDYREQGLFTSYHHRLLPYGVMPGPYAPSGGPMPPGHHRQWANEGERIPRNESQGRRGEKQTYDRPYFRHRGTDRRHMMYRYSSRDWAYYPMRMLAGTLLGQTVINKYGEEVATVEDLIIGTESKIKALILSYGSFLDFDEKLVTVPFRPIGFTDLGITYDITRRELENQPRFNGKK